MDYIKLKNLVNKGCSLRETAHEFKVSVGSIRYHLKHLNLKTLRSIKSKNLNCKICTRKLLLNKRNDSFCNSCKTKIRRHRSKLAAIKYLGSVCNRCGYQENTAAFIFHHIDPKTKSFTLGCISNRRWEIIKAELDKCELLCANCHTIEHSNREDVIFLEHAKNYKGRNLDWDS